MHERLDNMSFHTFTITQSYAVSQIRTKGGKGRSNESATACIATRKLWYNLTDPSNDLWRFESNAKTAILN